MNSDKPEVKHRARFIYDRRKADLMNSLEPFPFIDSMWWSTEQHTYCYDNPWRMSLSRYMGEWEWDSSHPFVGYRHASARWASDMLDSGVPQWAIKLLFWELHRRDADFLSRFGFRQP